MTALQARRQLPQHARVRRETKSDGAAGYTAFMSEKTTYSIDLRERHYAYLGQMAEKYGLPDESKTLRILIEHAMQEGDADRIYVPIRCPGDC